MALLILANQRQLQGIIPTYFLHQNEWNHLDVKKLLIGIFHQRYNSIYHKMRSVCLLRLLNHFQSDQYKPNYYRLAPIDSLDQIVPQSWSPAMSVCCKLNLRFYSFKLSVIATICLNQSGIFQISPVLKKPPFA